MVKVVTNRLKVTLEDFYISFKNFDYINSC